MIERIAQINSRPYEYLRYGYCIQVSNLDDTKYFNASVGSPKNSGGWTKEDFLRLCNNFRLEFVYG